MAAFTDTSPRIAYDDLGAASGGEPALLMLTGWCSSRERWAEAAPLAARRRRVVSFDWRGHGDSDEAPDDFGLEEMVSDALSVADAAGLETFVPCAASHSGWVAIELRRRFPERVPALVHVDWMVVELSKPYLAVLEQLTSTGEWRQGRDTLFEIWRAGVDAPFVDRALAVLRAHGAEMWMRSGREIRDAYAREGSPIAAWRTLDPIPPVLHVYGQPPAPEYLAVQEALAAEEPWFRVRRVPAVTHFAMLERPQEVDAAIGSFLATAVAEPTHAGRSA